MKNIRLILCLAIVFVMCFGTFVAEAAYETHESDVELVCDLAVEYVNSGNKEAFEDYISEGVDRLIKEGEFSSSKFVYLYEQDPKFADVQNNQLSKIVSVIGKIYIKGEEAKLKQSDINKNVTPGYNDEAGVNDYEDDDAEVFMEIISKGKELLKPVSSSTEKTNADKKTEKKDAMPPEANDDAAKKQKSSAGGTSLGVVILVSIIVSSIVFAAGVYALRQADSKKGTSDKKGVADDDDVYNLRLAVKSMQASLQKADGNFKELDKLRIQVDEIDEKMEHITEYLRKLNRSE